MRHVPNDFWSFQLSHREDRPVPAAKDKLWADTSRHNFDGQQATQQKLWYIVPYMVQLMHVNAISNTSPQATRSGKQLEKQNNKQFSPTPSLFGSKTNPYFQRPNPWFKDLVPRLLCPQAKGELGQAETPLLRRFVQQMLQAQGDVLPSWRPRWTGEMRI